MICLYLIIFSHKRGACLYKIEYKCAICVFLSLYFVHSHSTCFRVLNSSVMFVYFSFFIWQVRQALTSSFTFKHIGHVITEDIHRLNSIDSIRSIDKDTPCFVLLLVTQGGYQEGTYVQNRQIFTHSPFVCFSTFLVIPLKRIHAFNFSIIKHYNCI